ncbi:MAG: hypothetical protein AAGF97_18645 [Planctomycetota bacterium]
MYFADCTCGHRTPVRLSQAGSTTACDACRRAVDVPRVSELKRSSGQSNPFLDVNTSVTHAVTSAEPPFDGKCHRCQQADATHQRPVTLRYLEERKVSDYEGLQMGIAGPMLVVGQSSEQWKHLRFPLLFCTSCNRDFGEEIRRASWADMFKDTVLLAFFIPLLVVLVVIAFFALFIVVAPLLILVATMALRHRFRKAVNPAVLRQLQAVPLVATAIDTADEYQIDVRASRLL